MNIAAITFMNNLSGTIPLVFDYMIIDFGSLGLQASVFHLEVNKELRCLSHAYTRDMSGNVIDDILFKYFSPFVQEEWGKLMNDPRNSSYTSEQRKKFLMSKMQNLLKLLRQLKTLTNTASDVVGTVTLVPFDEDIEVKITQSQFSPLIRRELEGWVQNILSNAINKAKEKSGNLNLRYVRWTGCSALLPIFQDIVKNFFKQCRMLFLYSLVDLVIYFVLFSLFLFSPFLSLTY